MDEFETRARELLARMTLAQKVNQMSGDPSLLGFGLQVAMEGYNFSAMPAGKDEALGIEPLRFSDGPRGVVMNHSTCFPVAMARGASWDPELEERIGDAIGVELRTLGANFYGGVCINLLRHPAWGRAQETYGEDPWLLGEMGAALVRGVQRHAMACAKHFAANSIENARFKVDVQIDERTLHEVYLPHFRRVVREGVAAMMSAYNKLNGEYCGHNAPLLRRILKEQWGFQGLVMSDFMWGVRDAEAAALGGLDVEMPAKWHYHRRLPGLVRSGRVPEAVLDEAVLRILRTRLRFAAVGEPERYVPDAVAGPAHRALAREAAVRSMVLLQNEPVEGRPVLPLDMAGIGRLAVVGELAAAANIGDHGSSRVRPPHVVTALDGLREACPPGVELLAYSGRNAKQAARVAAAADVAVVVAGYGHRDEGEYMASFLAAAGGGDRAALTLPARQERLVRAVTAANPRTVVVLIGGSAVVCEGWRRQAAAILMAWYPGMEGGHALADILLGKANPSGRLPCSFPVSAAQLPFFDRNAESIAYDRWHGYWKMDREGQAPAFAFGFGLSYTTFAYGPPRVDRMRAAAGESLRVELEVCNTGGRPGATVAQLYAGGPGAGVERPVRQLKGFRRVELAAGETRTVALELAVDELRVYEPGRGEWVLAAGEYPLYVGSSSREGDLQAVVVSG